VLNALVFQVFQGALITGAQLNDDGTARTDFDLPDVDNDRLRALEPQLNDVIRQDLPLRVSWVAADALASEPEADSAAARWRPPPRPTQRARGRDRRTRPAGLRAGRISRPPAARAVCESSRSTQRPPQPPREDRPRRLDGSQQASGVTFMATILFIVKATIPADKEAAFNRWYNEEHVIQACSFREWSARTGTSSSTAMTSTAIWPCTSCGTSDYRRFVASDHMKTLRREYDGPLPDERARAAGLRAAVAVTAILDRAAEEPAAVTRDATRVPRSRSRRSRPRPGSRGFFFVRSRPARRRDDPRLVRAGGISLMPESAGHPRAGSSFEPGRIPT